MYKQSTKTSQILIIEDDEEFNATLSKMLKSKGYGVVRAMTGRDGLNLASKFPVDLVIADIFLPGLGSPLHHIGRSGRVRQGGT